MRKPNNTTEINLLNPDNLKAALIRKPEYAMLKKKDK